MQHKKILYTFLLFFIMTTNVAFCQHTLHFNIPDEICKGDSILVTIGYDSANTVVVSSEASLGHSDCIFLPDGVPCGDLGCNYVSPVTFSSFLSADTISSAEDINYVRINIEHSYIGDLYINIKCPNGQKADLLRFGGAGISQCTETIPLSSRGWLNGNNMEPGTNLGNAISSYDVNNPCDSSTVLNDPGYGWTYCWSNNTTRGYQYASGDGIIYRNGHNHNSKVDSSKVATGVNFYHPDENFSSLIGCPINGEWNIEVIDGYNKDNGYLFGWEISLNTELLNRCTLDSFVVVGNGVTQINDSCFVIRTPENLTSDARWLYHIRCYDHCGNVVDTVFFITHHPSFDIEETQEVVENDLPVTYCGQTFNDDVEDYVFNYSTAYGCDSNIHYSLKVWHNVETIFDTVVCETSLPLQWHGMEFVRSDSSIFYLHTVHGADSIVRYVLHTKHQDTIDFIKTICDGISYTWFDGVTYSDTTIHPIFVLPSSGVCDSILRLILRYAQYTFNATFAVSPNPVQMDNPECRAVDLSDSRRREWSIIDRIDTSRIITFDYPIEYDSVEVVMLAYDINGCSDIDTQTVYLDKTKFWTPNAFTPDNQTNSSFSIPSEGVVKGEVQIFSRSGMHIATFDLLTGSWDGTHNGRPCPQDSYVWHIKYVSSCRPKIENEAVGTVTLLR